MNWSMWPHDRWQSWGWPQEILPESQQAQLLFLCSHCSHCVCTQCVCKPLEHLIRKNHMITKWNGDIMSLQTTVDKRGWIHGIRCDGVKHAIRRATVEINRGKQPLLLSGLTMLFFLLSRTVDSGATWKVQGLGLIENFTRSESHSVLRHVLLPKLNPGVGEGG